MSTESQTKNRKLKQTKLKTYKIKMFISNRWLIVSNKTKNTFNEQPTRNLMGFSVFDLEILMLGP